MKARVGTFCREGDQQLGGEVRVDEREQRTMPHMCENNIMKSITSCADFKQKKSGRRKNRNNTECNQRRQGKGKKRKKDACRRRNAPGE